MNNRIFVGHLKYEVTDDELRDAFAEAGPVANLDVVRDKEGRAKFAFVEMVNGSDAATAIENLTGLEIRGMAIRCEPAKARSQMSGERNREDGNHARPGSRRWA